MIRKRIASAGNSAAILLSQDLLGLMGVAIGDEVELRLVDRSLLVRPLAESERKARVRTAMDRVFSEHAGLLRRLAQDDPGHAGSPPAPKSGARKRQAKTTRASRPPARKRA